MIKAGFEMNTWAYGAMINVSAQCDHFDRAFFHLENMDKSGMAIEMSSCGSLVQGLLKLGCIDRVEAIFESAQKEGRELPTTAMYNSLISACTKIAAPEKTLYWFEA